jgi:hypothetical protein
MLAAWKILFSFSSSTGFELYARTERLRLMTSKNSNSAQSAFLLEAN